MRGDVYVQEVLNKCTALKKARLWLPEPRMRPNAWLKNFDVSDQPLAAVLLDNFTFYGDELTNRLLVGSYSSLADGMPKGPAAPDRATLIGALPSAVFTRVEGEDPRPTDSGNLFCRKARQVLRISDDRFLEPTDALGAAMRGTPVIFLDDFVGSGDQFIKTWKRAYRPNAAPTCFRDAMQAAPFTAIYVTLVATEYGLTQIRAAAPRVAVTVAHVLDETSTVRGLTTHPSFAISDLQDAVAKFLDKYVPRLQPPPDISQSATYIRYGYKSRGLMFSFEHSVPDATLPIFWSPGDRDWNPLVERR